MSTDLLAAKYALAFTHCDRDGDGRAGLTDVLELGTRVVTAFGVSSTTGSGKAFMDGLTNLWEGLASATQPDALGRITVEQFQQAAPSVFVDRYDQIVAPIDNAVLEILDPNKSGVVGTAEFTKLLQAVGVKPDQVPTSIQALDQDGDGSLTVDQLRTASREFFTSTEQDAPGNMVFGQF